MKNDTKLSPRPHHKAIKNLVIKKTDLDNKMNRGGEPKVAQMNPS